MSAWAGPLGEALEVLIDHRGKTPKKLGGDWTPGGVPVYSAIHVKNGRLAADDARTVSAEMFERWMPIKLRANDVLLTSEAPLGEVALIHDDQPACLGQRLFGLRGRAEVLDGGYLYYLLQHQPVRAQILGRASGTTVSGIRQAELVQVRLELPDVPYQQRVAGVLGALDDKIDSNRRRSQIAESLLDVLAAAVVGGVGVPLRELAAVDRTACVPASAGATLVDHFSLPAFDAARLPDRTPGESIKSNKLVVASESVLVSRLNPATNRTWFAVPEPGVMAAASTEFMVLRPDSRVGLGGLWLAVRDEYFRSELARRATGTSGSHQRVRPDDLLSIEAPDVRALDAALDAEAEGLLRLVHQARTESATLADLRDALLPELLSGRLRVPFAEDLVGLAT